MNFKNLMTLAKNSGVSEYGTISQGSFLKNLGIDHRAKKLIELNQNQETNIKESVDKLTNPKEMGEVFKVLAISHKRYNNIPGF